MAILKNTAERGKFKEEIHKALYNSSDIKELLLGDISGKKQSEVMADFKNHVFSHLFIDDTITETDSFIFYDVQFPELHSTIKTCQVVLYAICHRDILDNYFKDGYYGNRADILSQMIEDVLVNNPKAARNYGIGELTLDSVLIYNSVRFYGCRLYLSVPDFR